MGFGRCEVFRQKKHSVAAKCEVEDASQEDHMPGLFVEVACGLKVESRKVNVARAAC